MGCVINTGHGPRVVNYQDIWFKGKAILRGGRHCEFRYFAIENYLKKFKRPISVLDIGANMGYFSWRLMEKFQGTFTMVEGDAYTGKVLKRLCKLNNNPQAALLSRRFCLQDLKDLAESEHFDVVIALSVIHHFDEPYQEVLEALTRLGSCLIFEPPSVDEYTLNQDRIVKEPLDLSKFRKKLLVRTLTHNAEIKRVYRHIYAITNQQNPVLLRPSFRCPVKFASSVGIQADFKQRLASTDHFKATWPLGINLSTFISMRGLYPTKPRILSMLDSLHLQDEDQIHPSELILANGRLHRLPLGLDVNRELRQAEPCTVAQLRKHLTDSLLDD
jgi:hypothetical protein